MKRFLEILTKGQRLNEAQAYDLMKLALQANSNKLQFAAILGILGARSVSLEELIGFRSALVEERISVDLGRDDLIDLCGTGGDGKDTFNISTISSFVVAGAGIPVAKHGNFGSSSSCGSSNLLEALGLKLTADPEILRRSLAGSSFCYLHAPLFYPALKELAALRKELGVRTVFNMLGPLLHPGGAKKFSTGVATLQLLRLYSYFYQKTDLS